MAQTLTTKALTIFQKPLLFSAATCFAHKTRKTSS
jgi:hypothetical protein